MKSHRTSTQAAWRSGPLLPPLPQTTSLAVYDLRATSDEDRLSVASLTGLVNRGPARLYLLETGEDEFWLTQIEASLPRTTPQVGPGGLLEHLLTMYRAEVQGLVIYDPLLLDTVNVATTLAALRDGLVVSPTQAERLQVGPDHLPVLADLRVHGWKTRAQAYEWAYQELLPQCSRELVAGFGPGTPNHLRAFLSAHRVFIYWLDGRRAWPWTKNRQPGERPLLKRILSSFSPGALHLGWYIDEPSGVRLNSSAGICTFASDFCTNLEVWSTLPLPASQPEPAPRKEPVSVSRQSTGRPTYLSFTFSDGDNLQYCQRRLLQMWRDPARGSLPLGWTIPPALSELMPHLAAFYRASASANDEFIAGPSGAGYLLPSRLPREQCEAFLALTIKYMRDMDLNVLQVLDSNTKFSQQMLNPCLQKLYVERLAPLGLRGILNGCGTFCPSWHQRAGLPIYQNLGLSSSPEGTLRLIKKAARRGTRYINIYVFAWKLTPGDLQGIVKQLGTGFEVVTPGQLLELIAQE